MGVIPKAKQQDVHFCSLKKLWLSLLPEAVRKNRFPDALEQIPSKLITTSSFCDFFSELPSSVKGSLDGERAWFGIRSILKGGALSIKLWDQESRSFQQKHLAQLGKHKNLEQIHAKHTRKYFSDAELRELLVIYDHYQNFLHKHELYDDIDIVLRALSHHSGDKALNESKKNEKFEQSLVRQSGKKSLTLRLNNDRVIFRQTAEKEIGKNLTNSNKKILHGWLTRNILDHEIFRSEQLSKINAECVAETNAGIPIYKSPLGKGGRIFWTPRNQKKRNEIQIVVYDFCLKKEKGDPRLTKILKNHKFEKKNDEVRIIGAVDFEIDQLPGDGPSKPWPHSKDVSLGQLENVIDDANILLDEIQEKAIVSNQPLLIDGLAGTGKTSVLSFRGVTRCVASPHGTKVMVLASKDHVVQRISETMDKISKRGDWGEVEFNMNYILGPGISNPQQETLNLDSFIRELPDAGFDEIILDECQDITSVEFEMLKRLLIGHNLRRLVFAGDPLQTLNPTGFDWNRLKAMFIENNVQQKHVGIQQFHFNYRSQRKIVEFANAIQIKRGEALGEDQNTIMIPKKEGDERIRFIEFDLETNGHMAAIEEILENSGESRAIVITPAPDDTGIQHLLGGIGDGDPVMKRVWENACNRNKNLNLSSFRDALYLHSASSVKGAEYKVVVLYRFAGTKNARENLSSLRESPSNVSKVSKDNQIAVRYEFSKLYVALTRAFDRVYIIEDGDGRAFWESIDITDSDRVSQNIDHFIDFINFTNPIVACTAEDLKPEQNATKENYERERNSFRKDPSSVVNLESAIGLGRRLFDKAPTIELELELFDLEGERAWMKSRRPSLEESAKKKWQKEAMEKFTKAKQYEKVAPIHYSAKNYKECMNAMDGLTENKFYKFIKIVCQIKLEKPKTKDRVPDWKVLGIEELMSGLDRDIIPKGAWQRITPMDYGRSIIEDHIIKSNTLTQILENTKSNRYFSTHDLFESFKLVEDRIKLLEFRMQTRTALWSGNYHDLLCQLIESQSSTDQMNEIYYAKNDKRSNFKSDKQRNKQWQDLRFSIDMRMLRELPEVTKPRLKLDILLNQENIDKNPSSIQNIQNRGVLLARRIHKSSDVKHQLGIFSEIFEASSQDSSELIFKHTEIVEKLLPSLRFSVEEKKFTDYPNLRWFNHRNYKDMLDSHINELWKDSIDEKYQGQEPKDIWKENISGDQFIRGKKGTNEKQTRLREFEAWFRNFYRYANSTSYKANVERILMKLFSWFDFEGVDLSLAGQSCIEAIINSKSQSSNLYDCERNFIINYMTNRDVQIKPKYWSELKNLGNQDLNRKLNVAEWERKNIVFINEYEDIDTNKLDQKKLEKYIKILKENGEETSALKAEGMRVISDKDAAIVLDKLWSSNQMEAYLEKRNELFSRGVKLPKMEVFDETKLDILDWVVDSGFGFMKESLFARNLIENEIFNFICADSFASWLTKVYLEESGELLFEIDEPYPSTGDDLEEYRSFIIKELINEHLPERTISKKRDFEKFIDREAPVESNVITNIRMLMAFATRQGLYSIKQKGLTLKPELDFLEEHSPFKEESIKLKVIKIRSYNDS